MADVCEKYLRLVEKTSLKLWNKKEWKTGCLLKIASQVGMLPVQKRELSNLPPHVAKDRLIDFMQAQLMSCLEGNKETMARLVMLMSSYTGTLLPMAGGYGVMGMFAMSGPKAASALADVVKDIVLKKVDFTDNDTLLTTKKALKDWIDTMTTMFGKLFRKIVPDFEEQQLANLDEVYRGIILYDKQDPRRDMYMDALYNKLGLDSDTGATTLKTRTTKERYGQLREEILEMIQKLSETSQLRLKRLKNIDVETRDQLRQFYLEAINVITQLRQSLKVLYEDQCLHHARSRSNPRAPYKNWKEVYNEAPRSVCDAYEADAQRLDSIIEQMATQVGKLLVSDVRFKELAAKLKDLGRLTQVLNNLAAAAV